MIKEVIVVEGLHDMQKLKSIDPTIDCITTNGTALGEATLQLIERAQKSRGVILMLDPDHPGRTITKAIVDRVPGVKVAFLKNTDAKSKNQKKVGVEHAGKAPILDALEASKTILPPSEIPVCTAFDLRDLGLSGQGDCAKRRHAVAAKLFLPPSNAKTFLKWLQMFQIPLEVLKEACR